MQSASRDIILIEAGVLKCAYDVKVILMEKNDNENIMYIYEKTFITNIMFAILIDF